MRSFATAPDRRRRRGAAILALLGCLALGPGVSNAAPALSENEAKALFILNFAHYIEWPADALEGPDAPLTLCVVGYDSKGMDVGELAGRRVGRRSIVVRQGVNAEDGAGCHIAYIGDSEERRVAATIRALSKYPLLTISDIYGFIDAGGALGLVRTGDRLAFEVNRDALQVSRLKASAHLLRLARNL